MDNNISQIRIKYIPSIFPSVDYTDLKFIEGRVIRTMESEPILDVTDKKFKTVFNPNISENVAIQSILYTKHYLEFFVNESINIDILKIGDEIEVIDENGDSFKAKFISSVTEKQADTFLYKCVFEFFKVVNDELAVSNYLTSDYLLQRTTGANLHKFTIKAFKDIDANLLSTQELTFYTCLNPIYSRTEKKILSDQNPNGEELESASFDAAVISLRFYLTENEKNQIAAYTNRCFQKGYANNPIIVLSGGAGNYEAIRVPTIEIVDKDLIGIYEVTVSVVYSEINFYNY